MKSLTRRITKLEARLNPVRIEFAPLEYDPRRPFDPADWPWTADNPMPKTHAEWLRVPGFDPRRQLTFG